MQFDLFGCEVISVKCQTIYITFPETVLMHGVSQNKPGGGCLLHAVFQVLNPFFFLSADHLYMHLYLHHLWLYLEIFLSDFTPLFTSAILSFSNLILYAVYVTPPQALDLAP